MPSLTAWVLAEKLAKVCKVQGMPRLVGMVAKQVSVVNECLPVHARKTLSFQDVNNGYV